MDKVKKPFLFVILFHVTLFLLINAICIKYNVIDFDLFSRLIQGWSVANNHSVLYNDIVSYIPTHTWYDPEWLSSAFIYLICHKFGALGLCILKIVLIYLYFLSVFVCVNYSKRSAESSYNILYYIMLIAFSYSTLIAFCVRCQVITFILFTIWIFLLEKIRRGNDKLFIFLPIIMLFWLNIHGGCIAGVGILFLYGLGELLNKKNANKYFITLFVVCLMFPINPWGISYLKFIIESAYLDRSWIAEWQSPFIEFDILHIVCFFTIVFCYVFAIYKNKIKFASIDKTKLIVLLMLAFLYVKHIKHTCLLISGVSILMYDDIFFCYHYFMEKLRIYLKIDSNNIANLQKAKNIILYLILIIYSVTVLCINPIKTSFYKKTSEQLPLSAVEFLKLNDIKGNLFSVFSISSYIAYKCYPNIKIYMDGRQEQVYSSDAMDKQLFMIFALGKNHMKVISDYPHDIILLNKDYTISKKISKLSDWMKIYEDEKYSIFIKKSLAKFNYKPVTKTKNQILEEMFDSYFK